MTDKPDLLRMAAERVAEEYARIHVEAGSPGLDRAISDLALIVNGQPPSRSPETYRELGRLAIEAALDAPLRQGKWTASGGINWTTIHAIRAELDRLGIDWRTHHRQTRKRLEAGTATFERPG